MFRLNFTAFHRHGAPIGRTYHVASSRYWRLIHKRKQRQHLRTILGQTPVARPSITELPLNHAERLILDGPDLAALGGDVPFEFTPYRRVFLGSRVAGVAKHDVLFAVQQISQLGHITYVRRSRHHAAYQAGDLVHANLRLHADDCMDVQLS